MLQWIPAHIFKLVVSVLTLCAFFLTPELSYSAQAKLTWSCNTPGVNNYCVFKRTQDQSYNYNKPAWKGSGTSRTIGNLEEGTKYFFVVRSLKNGKQSTNSNEVSLTPSSTTNPNDNQPPVGDGNGSNSDTPPSSSNTNPPPSSALPLIIDNDTKITMQSGDVKIDHRWKRVKFTKSFYNPIVVTGPISARGSQPAVVRIKNVNTKGFDIRIQEWNYLDGRHVTETVSYLVMEQGNYTLGDGTRIEADSLSINAGKNFRKIKFNQPFKVNPVVTSSITSFDDPQTATVRMKKITRNSFNCLLQEQESNKADHGSEMLAYIAWEPSSGSIGNIDFIVKYTKNKITNKYFNILFETPFKSSPAFISAMQTTNGKDTASVRCSDKDRFAVDVRIEEEQSRNAETTHIPEALGVMSFCKK